MKANRISLIAATSVFALALTACGAGTTESSNESSASSSSSASQASGTVTVTDNYGEHTVTVPPQKVVATDNRTFEVLEEWGVSLVAAPVPLIPDTVETYKNDSSITDIGNHREPNLELLAAEEPDLIINGQRFSQYYEDIKSLNPEATILELEPRDGEPLDSELKRQVTTLGEVFGKQAEAEQLIADFDAALARAKAAYDGESTVMAVNVSGGEIGYIAPSMGRTYGPVFDMLDLKPALEVEGSSDNHQGDDISVEAIAEANPDWLLVLDRDAATSNDEGSAAAADVIAGSSALANVTAVTKDQIQYAPADTYTNESIITYTEILNDLADKFEAAK
ncbi:iron ABC transporter substrate-binding protein [Rothia nasimurium]|uniref:Iron ABC transporter substrate-binding protein n=1 Tax=Rothia nasimurium TaxID=85336 RepID=A0A1Y1RQX7_9MICC|nr:ABC transporter substrate-binding protein [Rothia nasimurium]ORC22143.1 iron ABC transporter substrate-binding protein [Rothia nasimurium]